jgi:mediator of RNA polymerase II transcription subunit 17
MNGPTEALTLRPWPRDGTETTALQDVLARVNFERGHFRDINEASLQEEIAAEGGIELSESDDDEEDEDTETGVEAKQNKASSREDLYRIKHEMLAFVAQAEQDVLKSLDFVSLLESAQNPNGGVTVSQVLKQNVPLGSLGTDVWHRMPEDKPRKAQEALIATSVRLQGLQKSADTLLAAAARLEENARQETKYWEEILSIADKGWSVSRIRQRSHMLGVHFGFNGSLPEFARRDLAALVTNSDGEITLERGIGTKPTALRVVIRKDGRVVGSSKLPVIPRHNDADLDTRIRYARDSLYDEELNHELIQESRSMAAMGIRLEGSRICFAASSTISPDQLQVSFELIPLDANHNLGSNVTNQKDNLAESILLAARLLLSQTHRDRLKAKARVPQPLSEKKEEPPVYPILRPLVWLFRHTSNLEDVNGRLEAVRELLKQASIRCNFVRSSISFPLLASATSADSLIATALQLVQSSARFEIIIGDDNDTPSTIEIIVRTHLHFPTGTLFSIIGPDGARSSDFTDVAQLLDIFDNLVTGLLARLLASQLGTEWRSQVRTSQVCRILQAADSTRIAELTIHMDSKTQTLNLNSYLDRTEWSSLAANNSSQQTFIEAAETLAGAVA